MSELLIVEDDDGIAEALQLALTGLGHSVLLANTAERGLELLAGDAGRRTELVVVDVMLPGMDGFELCRALAATKATPVILLTARSEPVDIVVGLECGADDYVVKPVEPRVLDARIKAVLRRGVSLPVGSSGVLRFGRIVVDQEAMVVMRDGDELHLTPTELRLLLELAQHPGQVLSRRALLERVWEYGYVGDSRLVDACVQRLRVKVEDEAANPRLIRTVRGLGYRLVVP